MQTFLPYSNFGRSAISLDSRRLGKQRVENLQIMTALLEGRGWIHHPAVRMWKGHESALLRYQFAICNEWVRRNFHDTCQLKTMKLFLKHREAPEELDQPDWLGNPDFHISHQSNLVRKDPVFYGSRFPGVPNDLPYYWPR